ncbi:hypothetical protein, partial [Bradyrhizobium mercantei]|uniref:hypothetical protein n=1 Tax=Bradyrhizobium mercantei TaxID=1904807 RepID=UPI001AEC92F6
GLIENIEVMFGDVDSDVTKGYDHGACPCDARSVGAASCNCSGCRWNGRETGPDHGVKRQGPNGFPPTFIMTDFQDTGTHIHQRWFC